ncbi:MAG: hypothetical protein JWL81_2888 [Verrucomicrobiales bacterium]|nr:hypothetical protein [Verrucomicrobiales bacterium]
MNFATRSRSELLQAVVLLGAVLAAPLLLPREAGAQKVKPVPFDQERYDKAARKNPDVVMIGNSMLNTRLDKRLLDDMSEPNSIAYVAEGGTRSLVWYLKLKNFAAPLNPPPKVVFIFYRDFDFTAPWLNLEGERLQTARTFMKPEDEELLEFAKRQGGIAPRSPLDFYLPEQLTLKLRGKISDAALDIGGVGRGRSGDTELQEQLNALFDFQNLRADVFDAGAVANDILPTDFKLFTIDPAKNFLEKFNHLAKEKGMRLIFYRVKRRPNEKNVVLQDKELVEYTSDFRTWAESQGHLLIDETEDPRLTLSMYHDGDHLGKHAMAEYTHIFFERVKHCLPVPPRPAPAAAPTPSP